MLFQAPLKTTLDRPSTQADTVPNERKTSEEGPIDVSTRATIFVNANETKLCNMKGACAGAQF